MFSRASMPTMAPSIVVRIRKTEPQTIGKRAQLHLVRDALTPKMMLHLATTQRATSVLKTITMRTTSRTNCASLTKNQTDSATMTLTMAFLKSQAPSPVQTTMQQVLLVTTQVLAKQLSHMTSTTCRSMPALTVAYTTHHLWLSACALTATNGSAMARD